MNKEEAGGARKRTEIEQRESGQAADAQRGGPTERREVTRTRSPGPSRAAADLAGRSRKHRD